jgi:pimeloyl-ACP methyl ester carboxylesterase
VGDSRFVSTSTRIDTLLRIEEQMGYFGPTSTPLFCSLYAPLDSPALAAVVVCSSLDADFTLNYRRLVVLARQLAARGVLVQRFHYRGVGHSYGDPAATTYDDLVNDALLASHVLLERFAVAPLSLLGTGWGAIVAASAASKLPLASLVFWEPLTSPEPYYEEALRALRIRHLLHASAARPPDERPLEESMAGGALDIFGYPLHRALYESSKDRSLTGELPPPPRRILMLRPAGKDAYRTDYQTLLSKWKTLGFAVDCFEAGRPVPIWFHGPQTLQVDEVAEDVAARIHAWLSAHLIA